MDAVIFLLLVVILFLILSMRGNLNDRIAQIQSDIRHLGNRMEKLAAGAEIKKEPIEDEPAIRAIEKPADLRTPIATPPPIKQEEEWQSGFKRMDEGLEIPVTEERIEPLENEPIAPAYFPAGNINEAQNVPVPTPSFFERYPDLEKFIGENLISKIGIAILVIAIGFFVKYAIDQEWIGAIGRVSIGILCGGILIALAHKMRNNYKAFSSVLTGGGLAVFYFTITLAYQQFHLFSQTIAFVIMLVITAFSVALSLLYNKQEVAIIALVGGFVTPFMVSNGEGNYLSLFKYLVILNTGLLVIAYFKGWRLLNLLAFIFTVILFGSWLGTLAGGTGQEVYINGFWFATVFYLLFFIINLAHNIKENKRFIASDFGILLANTALYFGAGLYCLTTSGYEQYRGLFSALLGVFNLVASFILLRNKKADSNILYLLIGVTLTFISLTAPVQLKGNYITLFWSCETVLLYWLFQKSKIAIIQLSSFIVWVAMLFSLFMDWGNIYFSDSIDVLPIILNKGFITSLFATVATALLFGLRKKDGEEKFSPLSEFIPRAIVFGIASVMLLYISGSLEINFQFKNENISALYLLLYTISFVLVFLALLSKKIPAFQTSLLQPVLLGICLVFYLLHCTMIFNIQRELMEASDSSRMHFAAHWVTAALVAFVLFRFIRFIRKYGADNEPLLRTFSWVLCIFTIIFLSVELHLAVNANFVKDASSWWPVHTQFIKIGLPILWGICSFGFMWLGMHFKYRTLRIISLVLFAVTLFKLFAYDIRNIAEGGKIAAFFSLGVLLLVVSFMYQRLKKIIIDDGIRAENERLVKKED